MGAVAVFDYNTWQLRYPEFKSVNSDLAQMYFDEATLYFKNDGSGPCGDPVRQLMYLNMLTAHIAKLNAIVNGQAPSGLVGQITDASEGSVSVTVKPLSERPEDAWYNQTTYGAAFRRATAGYRLGHYRPFKRHIPSGGAFGGGGGFW